MKCGKCRGSHATVEEVRKCYQAGKQTAQPEAKEPPKITDNQLEFLNKLRLERDLYPHPDGSDPEVPRVRMTVRQASEEIDHLIHKVPRTDQPERHPEIERPPASWSAQAPAKVAVPRAAIRTVRHNVRIDNAMREQVQANNREHLRKNDPRLAYWDLPTGKHRYAIDGADGRETDFYLVNRPTEGKWAGYTFVKMVVGGRPSLDIRSKGRLNEILTEIEKDWDKAGARFGIELGRCRHCGVHLTDETSRALGAGPDCRAKHGVMSLCICSWSPSRCRKTRRCR